MQKLIFSFLTAILVLSLTACNRASSIKSYTKNGIYFDTLISITIYDQDSEKADNLLSECFNIAGKYESLFSYNNSESDIYRINHAEGQATIVDPLTISLIEKGIYYSNLSNGLYDISIYPASSLWDFHDAKIAALPDSNMLSEAIKHIDYKNIIIDNKASSITLSDPLASIDIGGIAKGFIGDKIAEYLISNSVSSAIINLGGDIKAIGSKENGVPYTIGITDPINGGSPILTLNIINKAVATSGTYERAFELDGKSYHHILDPKTGYPVNSDIISATIITEESADADTLCTVSILLGSSKAIKLIDSVSDTEAIFITTDGNIIKSENADQYIRY